MRLQSADTSLEIEKKQIELLRSAGLVRRIAILRNLTASTRRLSFKRMEDKG